MKHAFTIIAVTLIPLGIPAYLALQVFKAITCKHRRIRHRAAGGEYGLQCLHCLKVHKNTWQSLEVIR